MPQKGHTEEEILRALRDVEAGAVRARFTWTGFTHDVGCEPPLSYTNPGSPVIPGRSEPRRSKTQLILGPVWRGSSQAARSNFVGTNPGEQASQGISADIVGCLGHREGVAQIISAPAFVVDILIGSGRAT